ncbi:response regulator [Actinospongicola halichondriae]|uniref:response regulator n=1 Tax=Actinospongicola halichondriae TaxID=3236844 RepID=UPI003D40C1D6
MGRIRCQRCGQVGEDDLWTWSTVVRDGVQARLCAECTRLHVRDIESKLDEEWWSEELHPVLVVEDDESTRLLIRLSLESAGYQVDVASTGEEAIDLLDAGCRPAAIVADIRLPGAVDGWAVRERANAIAADTPVIIISAHEGDEGQAQRDVSYLTKPFDMDVLVDLVDRRTGDQAGVGRA